MGPALLLDKSGLQVLRKDLLVGLLRYYFLVVPPVLVTEIQADLTKLKSGGPKFLKGMATRLGSSQVFLNADHRLLRLGSLQGRDVPMDGSPIIGVEQFETSRGPSAIAVETENHKQLLNWRLGTVSEVDLASAAEWRQMLDTIDLEKTKAMLKRATPALPRADGWEELSRLADLMLGTGDQRRLLEMCLVDARVDAQSRAEIEARWEKEQPRSLQMFAPYAFYCFRLRFLFHLGLTSDLVSTKKSNTVDLIYLFFLPFTKIFSSNDQLQLELARLALRPDQTVISTTDLGRDLSGLMYFWDSQSQEGKEMWNDRFGNWPPRHPHSFTFRKWQETMSIPGGLRGNVRRHMSKEGKEKLDEHARNLMEQHQEAIAERERRRSGA